MLLMLVKELIMFYGICFWFVIKLFIFFFFLGVCCYDLMFVCMYYWVMNDIVDGMMVVKSDIDCICFFK